MKKLKKLALLMILLVFVTISCQTLKIDIVSVPVYELSKEKAEQMTKEDLLEFMTIEENSLYTYINDLIIKIKSAHLKRIYVDDQR